MDFEVKKTYFLIAIPLFFLGCSGSSGSGSGSSSGPDIATLSVENAQVTSNPGAPTQLVFTFNLSKKLPFNTSISYSTLSGTALSGVHFQEVSGTLNFPKGTSTQTVSVPVVADPGICNATKTMQLALSGASKGLKLAQANATGTITEADERSGAITDNETWSCVIHINGNTTISNAKVTVTAGGGIEFTGSGVNLQVGAASDGSEALVLQGTSNAPVMISTLSGKAAGYVTNIAPYAGINASYSTFTGIGDAQHPAIAAQLAAGSELVLTHSKFNSSGELQITSEDSSTQIQIQGNDFRHSLGPNAVSINLYGNSAHLVDSNTMDSAIFINTYGTPGATVSNNVLVGAASIAAYGQNITVTGNFIHQTSGPSATAALQIEADNSTVTGNYVRGGYWSIFAEGNGGTFENNIFETTSEIANQIVIASLPSASLWKGNILRGQSIWESTWIDSANQVTFRNNVLDVASSVGVWMNRSGAQNNTINFRNNVVIGLGTGIYDQPGAAGDVSYTDYNAFYNMGAADYSNINMPGMVQGSSLGFGLHDVHDDPRFTNRSVALSISDEGLLARSATPAAALAQIQAGYLPMSNSPLIGTGDPQDDGDPDVTDGSRDIGAIQK